MTVIAVSTFHAAPGGLYESLNLLRDGVKVFDRIGVRTQLTSLVRGGRPGELALFLEYPDLATYGETMERSYADDSMSSFMRRAQDVQALVPVDARDWVELPGCEAAWDDVQAASVVTTAVARVRDHGSDDRPALYRQWRDFMADAGITTRVLSSMHSDPAGLVAALAYYPDFTALGATTAQLQADPAYQHLLRELRGDTQRWDPVRNTIYRVV